MLFHITYPKNTFSNCLRQQPPGSAECPSSDPNIENEKKPGQMIQSTSFSIDPKQTNWSLHFYPNGSYPNCFLSNASLFLRSEANHPNEFEGICTLSIINKQGDQFVNLKQKVVVNKGPVCYGFNDFVKHSLIWDKANGLLPNDCLTIQCEFLKVGDIVNLSSSCEKKVESKTLPATESLPVHSILVALSPVFEAMFVNDMQEKSVGEVKIDDNKYEELKKMLRFIYTGQGENLISNAAELISLADKYQIFQLKNLCEKRLNQIISVDNVLDILDIAQQYNIEDLKNNAINFIKTHHKEIVVSDAFMSLTNVQVLKIVTTAISKMKDSI